MQQIQGGMPSEGFGVPQVSLDAIDNKMNGFLSGMAGGSRENGMQKYSLRFDQLGGDGKSNFFF